MNLAVERDAARAIPEGSGRVRRGPRAWIVHREIVAWVDRTLDGAVGLAARFTFLAVLAVYYLNAAKTKVGSGFPGVLVPGDGAYIQILPRAMERAGYDSGQIGPLGDLIVFAGTYAEFVLPVLIVVGLFGRLAALGMIVFVLVQSVVDIAFHGVDGETIGAWFDKASGSAILDQRLLWVFLLLTIVLRGPGWLSLDRVLARR